MEDIKALELNDAELDEVSGGAGKTSGNKIKITSSNGVNIRKKAEKGAEIIGVAHVGRTYSVLGKSGHYVKISAGGKEGYVYNGGANYFVFI
ncbi:MAG: SH3 domain-containing protein [Clostridia bacterium]|nr:SH3 domain-containing protein [Clostridia bacterium]